MTTLTLDVAAITHRGRQRERNEDAVGIAGDVLIGSMTRCKYYRLSVNDRMVVSVADGMGGHPAADVASRRAVISLHACLPLLDASDAIAETLHSIDCEVRDAGAADPRLTGMGTTIAGLVDAADNLFWFNIGDSRVFRFRDGFVRQLSVDDRLFLSEPNSLYAHRILQALGGWPRSAKIVPHIGVDLVVPGWHYLLCSDGLTDMLAFDEIESNIENDEVNSVNRLFEKTMEAGALDNVSIVMVTVREANDQKWEEEIAGA